MSQAAPRRQEDVSPDARPGLDAGLDGGEGQRAQDSRPVACGVPLAPEAPTVFLGAGQLFGLWPRRRVPVSKGQREHPTEDSQDRRHGPVACAPAKPVAQQQRYQQRARGGPQAITGVHPVDLPRPEMVGGVDVESRVGRPEAEPEKDESGCDKPERGSNGLYGQGHSCQHGANGQEWPYARGSGSALWRRWKPPKRLHRTPADPEGSHRFVEAEPHRWPEKTRGWTQEGRRSGTPSRQGGTGARRELL